MTDSTLDISDDATWLQLDEFTDVEISLQHLAICLGRVKFDELFWKWVILSAHSALQGACVCILTRTDGSGALEKKAERLLQQFHQHSSQKIACAHAGIEWHLDDIPYPDGKIANLPELLMRLPDELALRLPDRTDET